MNLLGGRLLGQENLDWDVLKGGIEGFWVSEGVDSCWLLRTRFQSI